MSDMCDLPHVALNKARSDFLPERTPYANEDNSNTNPTTQITSPPDSPMDVDMSLPFDFAMNNMEHISSLEQAICSNFTCCSIQLPDLHALVEHFEEKHVVVFSLDGMRIYPENSGKRLAHFPPPPSLSHSPSSSRSSSVVSSPQTPTTPLLVHQSSETTATKKSTSRASTSPCPPQVYTPFNISMIPETAAYGLGPLDLEIGLDPYHPMMISSSCPPPPYDTYPPHSSPESTTTLNKSAYSLKSKKSKGPSDSTTTSGGGGGGGGGGDDDFLNITSSLPSTSTSHQQERSSERRVRTKADIVHNATAVSAKNPLKAKARVTGGGGGGGNGKRREKAYRCPTLGCTKSYLNPNGLKYHVEKGTCRFEDSTDSEVVPVTENSRGTTPPTPITSSSTAPTPLSPSHLVINNEPSQPPLLGGNKSSAPPFSPLPPRISGTTKTTDGPSLVSYGSPSLSSSSMTGGYTLTRPLSTIPC